MATENRGQSTFSNRETGVRVPFPNHCAKKYSDPGSRRCLIHAFQQMIEPPSDPKLEAAAAAARGIASAIPFAGGLISEIGNLYLNPLEKRKKRWAQDVSDALNEIREVLKIMPEQLEKSESFISVLYQATEIAMRNHQSEKLVALRNALVSSAVPDQDYDLEMRMLKFVDELSLSHIRLLGIFDSHAGQFSRHEKLDQIFSAAKGYLQKPLDRIVFRSIVQDLVTRFLITLGDVEDFEEFKSKQQPLEAESSGIQPMRVTKLGKSFLTYIRADQL